MRSATDSKLTSLSSEMGVAVARTIVPGRTPNQSPAIGYRSRMYPVRFNGRVPRSVKTLRAIRSPYIPGDSSPTIVPKGVVCDCWVNSNGDVFALLKTAREIELHPDDFEVITYHEKI